MSEALGFDSQLYLHHEDIVHSRVPVLEVVHSDDERVNVRALQARTDLHITSTEEPGMQPNLSGSVKDWFGAPELSIAVERTLTLMAPGSSQLLRSRYGHQQTASRSLPATSRPGKVNPDSAPGNISRAVSEFSAVLPAVMEGTFDYAAWQSIPLIISSSDNPNSVIS